MTKEEYKKYMRGVSNTTRMLTTEAVGYGVAGKIAGMDTTGVASKAFATGSSLAGMPSLVYSASEVERAVDNMIVKKRR
jgi:hypothetical protein